MGDILITFVKQSSAYKLKKTANYYGIDAKIVQTPKAISSGGCSYAVLTKRRVLEKMMKICSEYEINYRRILAIYSDSEGKRIYNEL